MLGIVACGLDFAVAEQTGVDTGSARFGVFVLLDVLLGLPAIGLLLARRAHPVPVGVALGLLTGLSAMATPAALMALASVATRKRRWEIAAVAASWVVGSTVTEVLWRDPRSAPWTAAEVVIAAVLVIAVLAAAVAAGVSIGNRRELLASWQERARLVEAEQHWRETRARDHERSRMAGEMHDVLGHQLSLVAVHAGALHSRRDLSEEEKAESIAVVHERSRLALAELREVLDVLRSSSADDGDRPQPSLADLEDLLVDGADVRLDLRVETDQVPVTVGRHAYRIVQECLTNARKHAPGNAVQVVVAGEPGGALLLSVVNGRPTRAPAEPSRGHGLLGIDERARSVGGTATITSTPTEHRVEVALPWPQG